MTAGGATAVIAAAGSGARLGAGEPKALVELAGRPLLAWSLDAFAAAASVGAAVVAAPPGAEDAVRGIADSVAGLDVRVVAGGASRSQSVASALTAVEQDVVAVHDAARPLVTPELIDDLIDELGRRPGAAGVIVAAPLTDTVKRAHPPGSLGREAAAGGHVVEATLDRSDLWAAQTPQVFRVGVLREALAISPEHLAQATDDAALVESAGGEIVIHPAPGPNPKVTTPLDLRLAELLLRG